MIFGMRIFYSTAMNNPEFVKRTWKERLFTRPWKPLQKMKIINHPYMAKINNDLYAHPMFMTEIAKIGGGNG